MVTTKEFNEVTSEALRNAGISGPRKYAKWVQLIYAVYYEFNTVERARSRLVRALSESQMALAEGLNEIERLGG